MLNESEARRSDAFVFTVKKYARSSFRRQPDELSSRRGADWEVFCPGGFLSSRRRRNGSDRAIESGT